MKKQAQFRLISGWNFFIITPHLLQPENKADSGFIFELVYLQ